MKKITLIFAIAALFFTVSSCSSCGNQNGQEVKKIEKTQAEIMQEQLIQIHLDSIANDLTRLKPVGIVNCVKDGKVVLDAKEKQLKPDYLADPSFINNLQTLSQKYRAISILAAEKEVARLYDMPVGEYDNALAKLYADVNDPALKTYIEDDDYTESIKAFYESSKENNRVNLFWDGAGAAIIEDLYIATQNIDKFLSAFDDESASNTSYHITLLSIAIEDLAIINSEYETLNESLKPLQLINAINLEQLKEQLLEAKVQIAASRAEFLK